MKIINNYLKEAFFNKKKNAPTFAWETVHGKEHPTGKKGYAPDTKERNWNGHMIDELLKDEWLQQLNGMKEIEMRASCQGHKPDGEWPSFVIFRPVKNFNLDRFISKIADGKYTFAAYDKGNKGQTRICVATPLYAKGPKHKLWEKWWATLTVRIKKSI